jgi:uncharacterized protein
MAVVVSDTSPLRALHFIGHLELLPRLFDEVLIPPAVRDELVKPRFRFRPIDIQEIPSAFVRAPVNVQRVRELLQLLQLGEAEAIALAEEAGFGLLIDEASGRRVASRLGLQITGLAGVLIEAKRQAWVPAVLPLLEKLQDGLGFFLSKKFLDQVRRDTGE